MQINDSGSDTSTEGNLPDLSRQHMQATNGTTAVLPTVDGPKPHYQVPPWPHSGRPPTYGPRGRDHHHAVGRLNSDGLQLD